MNNMKTIIMIITTLIGLVCTVCVDLDAFKKAKVTKPDAQFDWYTAIPRWLGGVSAGLAGGGALLAGGAGGQ